MGKITGNEPVMPIVSEEMTSRYSNAPDTMLSVQSYGLTIRQQFAMAAMQGIISAWGVHDITDYRDIAHDSVIAADALIAELNKETEVQNG